MNNAGGSSGIYQPSGRATGQQFLYPNTNLFANHRLSDLSVESHDSVDSFTTQIPLPYHPTQQYGFQNSQEQNGGYAQSGPQQHVPASIFYGSSSAQYGNATQGSSSHQRVTSLNPASVAFNPSPSAYENGSGSASYITNGNGYNVRDGNGSFETAQTQHTGSFSRQGSASTSTSYGAQNQHGSQVGYDNYQYSQPQYGQQQQPTQQYQGTPYGQQNGFSPADYSYSNGVNGYLPSPSVPGIMSPTPSYAGHVSQAWGNLDRSSSYSNPYGPIAPPQGQYDYNKQQSSQNRSFSSAFGDGGVQSYGNNQGHANNQSLSNNQSFGNDQGSQHPYFKSSLSGHVGPVPSFYEQIAAHSATSTQKSKLYDPYVASKTNHGPYKELNTSSTNHKEAKKNKKSKQKPNNPAHSTSNASTANPAVGSKQNYNQDSNFAEKEKFLQKAFKDIRLEEGIVLTAPSVTAKSASSVNGISRNTSPERFVDIAGTGSNTRASSKASGHSRSKSVITTISQCRVDAATPGQHPRVLPLEFASEQRPTGLRTPVLRGVRNRALSEVAADNYMQLSQKTVASWLDDTPTGPSKDKSLTIFDRTATPPRMAGLGLNTTSSFRENRASQDQNDVFATPVRGVASVHQNLDPYRTPSSAMILGSQAFQYGRLAPIINRSKELAILTRNETVMPTLDEGLSKKNLPFVEYCREVQPDSFGVIKIKNIPYTVNRPEVLAFLGRNARVVPENEHEPVHIIMERVTSKTLDCYVEFINVGEAVSACNRFEVNKTGGRGGRLGQRHVEVEMSNQESLMADLFPKAKNVAWSTNGGKAEIIPRDPGDEYNSGFKGFVSSEELVMLVKHVESPQRSPFSKECPQRPFECMISTLLKYPWYMVDHITIDARNQLYQATFDMIRILIQRLQQGDPEDVLLTNMLFKRLWKAALKCPGFSPTMKDSIIVICGLDDSHVRENGIPPYAADWNHLWAIGSKPNAPRDLVMWYIGVIREASQASKQQMTLAQQARTTEDPNDHKLFGELKQKIGHDGKRLASMTLAEVAEKEWAALEELLRIGIGNMR